LLCFISNAAVQILWKGFLFQTQDLVAEISENTLVHFLLWTSTSFLFRFAVWQLCV